MDVAGLFAGIGGIEQGLQRAGHSTGLLCELDAQARSILSMRFPRVQLVHDVADIDRLPKVELVTAGFPCQDLSQAGRTLGIDGPKSSVISHLFRLLQPSDRPDSVLIENVPFLLYLERGKAMAFLVSTLEKLGYRWAYRVVDAMAFGLPQRRRRVWMFASRSIDPRSIVLGDDVAERPSSTGGRVASGFYWTEGTRGLGWVPEGVPPLKGGSGVGIPSPPAIWLPAERALQTPDIRDAERLQGFDAGWTEPASSAAARWKLVGNAVSVPVAEWIGRRLQNPGTYEAITDKELSEGDKWPKAAWGGSGRRFAAEVSDWPVSRPSELLSDFLRFPTRPLSARATSGFLRRARASRLHFEPGFLEDTAHHLECQTPGSVRRAGTSVPTA